MSTIPIHILHVDDDEDDRILFDEAIKKVSIDSDIVEVSDGTESMDILKTFLPDIIFLDINMAGMNGRDCLKLIRNQQKFDTIPIIMLTTSTRESDIADTFQSGANLFVTKPFRYEDFIILLQRIFSGNWKADLLKNTLTSYVFRNNKSTS